MDPYIRLLLQTETMKSGLVHLYHSFRGFSVECLGETWQAASCCVRLSVRNGRVRPIAMIDLLDVYFMKFCWGNLFELTPRTPGNSTRIISGVQQRETALIFGIILDGRFDGNQEAAETRSVSSWLDSVQLTNMHFFLLQVANEHNAMSFKCNCSK